LVFIDETWTKTNMAPLTGWAPRGTRLVTKVPHGHWKTMTFLAALRHDRVDAPWLLDGPIDGESFKTCARRFSFPRLNRATSLPWTISAQEKGHRKIFQKIFRALHKKNIPNALFYPQAISFSATRAIRGEKLDTPALVGACPLLSFHCA
jgi:hypothetical protein